MQRARAFFYVSLGVLALAVAFHLGARSAGGQVATTAVLGEIHQLSGGDAVAFAVDQDGKIWRADAAQAHITGPLDPPKAGRIIAVGLHGGGTTVLYEDGDWWHVNPPFFLFNIFGSAPVQTKPSTWGRIKAERR